LNSFGKKLASKTKKTIVSAAAAATTTTRVVNFRPDLESGPDNF